MASGCRIHEEECWRNNEQPMCVILNDASASYVQIEAASMKEDEDA